MTDKPFRARAVTPGSLFLGPALLLLGLLGTFGGSPLALLLAIVGGVVTWLGVSTRRKRVREAAEWNAAYEVDAPEPVE